MEAAVDERTLTELKASDRQAYLEQRIFVLSPFGTVLTALLLFAVFAGSYVLIALSEGLPIFSNTSDGLTLDSRARIALILSLLMSVILGVQRYVLMHQRTEMLNHASQFRGGAAAVAQASLITPAGSRLGLASLSGVPIGIAIVWMSFGGNSDVLSHWGILAWFSAMILIMTMSFTRGIELTRGGARSSAGLVRDNLIIDLLRVDRLAFLGRSAARFSMIWFAVGASSSLFIVNSGLTWFTLGLIAVFLVVGGLTFFGMMEGIHRAILVAKREELERIRSQIDAVRDAVTADPAASQKLQGLLAYEARIMAAPEWPFDQPTLMRLCASALILTLPWFGQAVAAYLIDHLGTR